MTLSYRRLLVQSKNYRQSSSTCHSSSSFVIYRPNIVVPHCSLSFLVISRHCGISMFSRSRLRRTGDPALYPHSTVHCVSVYRWFSYLCTCRHINVVLVVNRAHAVLLRLCPSFLEALVECSGLDKEIKLQPRLSTRKKMCSWWSCISHQEGGSCWCWICTIAIQR